MKLHEIVDTWTAVRATRSRNAKIDHLAALLAGRPAEQVERVVAWLSGELLQGRIGVGPAMVYGLGELAPGAQDLDVTEVEAVFITIAATKGAGSKAKKIGLLKELMTACTSEQQHFLRNLLTGEMRQGALGGVMLAAVARTAEVPIEAMRRAFMLSGDLRVAAVAAVRDGEEGLAAFQLEVFVAVQPMLAQTAASPTEALARLGEAAFEQKLDGARIQVHKQAHRVRVFTRHMREVTGAVPEVVELVRSLPCDTAILDGEVIALKEDGRPHPFQVTMRRFGRSKKTSVAEIRASIPLTPVFFDLLLLDGASLIDAAERERQAALQGLVPQTHRVQRVVTDREEAAEAFLEATLDAGHEGLMAKGLDGAYEAGNRGRGWLKIKPSHTLDLVVIAAEWGSGRREGWLSNLHLAARDGDGFVMLGKTFKGMTDEILAWQTEALQARATGKEGWAVTVRPELVVEVAFQDVQESPRYPSGMALRLARIKGYRPDKTAAEADTLDTVRAIFEGAR